MLVSWRVKVREKGKMYFYILFVNGYDDYIMARRRWPGGSMLF